MSRCAPNLPWGYQEVRPNKNQVSSPDPQQLQYEHLPAALLSTLKREKKPFTYTPGGVNLSQVLEARLQKRNERKKKYQEEVEQQNHAGRQLLVVSPTYNSPLNMYSMENALETLEVQAKMAASRSPSSTLPRNYKFKFQDEEEEEEAEPSQSKAFRVLQVMTDTEMYSGNKKPKEGPNLSQMRFTGLGRPTNPSKFFHTLQKITGTEQQEEEQQRRENLKPEKRTVTVPRVTVPVQPQPSFGAAPLLKRPAAFLPKQQAWSYQRTKLPVGTDF